MDKKPGQISSNTLSLRFMQNAAKARQEREIQVAQAKVKSEEEWELAPPVRESWSVAAQGDDQTLSYEPSYLPFLFPPANRPLSPGSSENVEEDSVPFKRRRKFGKDGKEEVEEKSPEDPPSPPPQKPHDDGLALARKSHSISSHGRAAVAASSSKPPRRRGPSPAPAPPAPVPPSPPPFLKPQTDAARTHQHGQSPGRRKRPRPADRAPVRVAIIDGPDDEARLKKKKRRE